MNKASTPRSASSLKYGVDGVTLRTTIGMNRVAGAEEIAHLIVRLLSEEASFVSGCCLDVSEGGFIAGERAI